MFEKKKQPLATKKTYAFRIVKSLTLAIFILIICLGIGIFGYMLTEDMSFIDALLNSSMLLSGMGPVKTNLTNQGKWFASFYALFSGVMFITNIGIILAPSIHRIFHQFHLDE